MKTVEKELLRRACLLSAMLLLSTHPLSAPAEVPIIGARTPEKAEWIRIWLGVQDRDSVTCAELESPCRAMTVRNIVSCSTLFSTEMIDEIYRKHGKDDEPPSKTRKEKIIEALQDLSEQGKEGAQGFLSDLSALRRTLPQCCLEAIRGNLNQAPCKRSKRTKQTIPPDDTVGLLVDERSRFILRDRIHWAWPPGLGANLRIRDIVQYGDQMLIEFKDRETSEKYKVRLLMPTATALHPAWGMDLAGQWYRHDADFTWNGETEAKTRERVVQVSPQARWYWDDSGSFLSMGTLLAQRNFSDDGYSDEDWTEYDGLYDEILAGISWNYSPLDYDPDVLFAPGAGAEVTLRISTEYLGAPASWEMLSAYYHLTKLLAEDVFWDLELRGSLCDGMPRVLLPTLGGGDTVRGHGSILSTDRMFSVQQTLRHSFQWKYGIVFIPLMLFDFGWGSQKSMDLERRSAWLEGVGAGIRWEFTEFYGFRMFEMTLARGLGRDEDFRTEFRSRFEF